MTRRFLRAWASAIVGGFAFVGMCALFLILLAAFALPAILLPEPWGLFVVGVLLFLVITALCALEEL